MMIELVIGFFVGCFLTAVVNGIMHLQETEDRKLLQQQYNGERKLRIHHERYIEGIKDGLKKQED